MSFKGKINSLYKKWELYLFRLFKIAKFCEKELHIMRINMPEYNEILDPEGYDGDFGKIPPNPFFFREDDKEFFLSFYSTLSVRNDTSDELKYIQHEVWRRMGEIKNFLGMTINTRFVGEAFVEKRLCEEIDLFVRHQDYFPLHKIMFSNIDAEEIRAFQKFLRDKRRIDGVYSVEQYYR